MDFSHTRIDADPPCSKLSSLETTDLTGNGLPDVIVTGTGGNPFVSFGGKQIQVPTAGPLTRFTPSLETNVFWYENPGWERHRLAPESDLHIGVGTELADIDGDGKVDFVFGQGFGRRGVYWYEQPADPRDPWDQHLITERFEKYHDLLVTDVDDDGEPELVGLSQDAETVFYFDIPDDPQQEPWPESHGHLIDENIRVEGVATADLVGDGKTELVAGTNIYSRDGGEWERTDICTGWDDTRVAIADLDRDGSPEIVLAEGDSPTYGTHPGRLAVVDYPDGDPQILREDLFCPHSLQTADLTGNGYPDIYVGEMGLGENTNPQQFVFENLGDGEFKEHVVVSGIPTHEAKLVDMNGNGKRDIIGKSYGPERHVDVWHRQ